MSRPTTWEPLSDSDRTPGDADEVRKLAGRYADTADEINRQAANLRKLAGAEGWQTPAGEKFAAKADDLAGDVEEADSRYSQGADILYDWASQLATSQSAADAAAIRAKAANDAKLASAPSGVDIKDPTPAQKSAETTRSANFDAAETDFTNASNDYFDAVDDYESAANNIKSRIDDIDDMKDSRWDKIKNAVSNAVDAVKQFIKDHAELFKAISEVLGVLATVLGVVGFILSFTPLAPLGAALMTAAAIVTGMKLLVDSALVWVGEGSWVDVGMDVFGLATFGAGKLIGALGKGAVTTARTSAQAANVSRATQAADTVTEGRQLLGAVTRADSFLTSAQRFPIIGGLASRAQNLTTARYLTNYVDELAGAVTKSQGAINVIDNPGYLNALKFGGWDNAGRVLTVRNIVGEFPEISSNLANVTRLQSVLTGSAWGLTGVGQTVNVVRGSYVDTAKNIGDYGSWSWNQVTGP